AIEVKRPGHRRDRARRRRGTRARRARLRAGASRTPEASGGRVGGEPVGEEFGVALVQPGDGASQPVLRPKLVAQEPAARVALDQPDIRYLVGPDVELAPQRAFRRYRTAKQGE